MKKRILKNKKAVSIMIGYVILIGIAITIGAVTYSWLQTYVPQEKTECPDRISIYISELNCYEVGGDTRMNLTLENNGNFNIDGYLIRATNSSEQEIASIDLSGNLTNGGMSKEGFVLFKERESLAPSEKSYPEFVISNDLYKVEIIPFVIDDKSSSSSMDFVSCSHARTSETIHDKCS